jgi:glycosyltransferase involved in cell wall biosynthesis
MRVGLVIYGSMNTVSGGFMYDRKLAAYLRRKGDTVEVISQPWRSYTACLVDGMSPGWLRKLAGLDVDVLLQDELNHPSLFGLNPRLRRNARFPLVSIVHHLRSSEKHCAIWMPFYQQIERAYLKSVGGFVFNSLTTRSTVESLTRQAAPEHVIARPAGDRFGSGLDEEVIKERAQHKGALRVLFVGNLTARKGLDTLIQALSRLPAEQVELRVVGRRDVDHAYTRRVDWLALKLAGRVKFLGGVSDAQLEEELRAADILAVPSQYEGFGIVYLEGMGFGLPAIGSTAGGAGEIIEDGVSGLLVTPGDVQGLADRVGQLAADRSKLAEMSLAARRRFTVFPRWEESMRQIRQYLLDVATI